MWRRIAITTWSISAFLAFVLVSMVSKNSLAIDPACTRQTSSGIYLCPEYSVDWYESYSALVSTSNALWTSIRVSGSRVSILNDTQFSSADVYSSSGAWTPTFTGFSVAPGSVVARFTRIGKLVNASMTTGTGTSNATFFTVTLPVAAATTGGIGYGFGVDNGGGLTSPCAVQTQGASATANVYRDFSGAAWTGSSTKYCQFSITYEANAN